MRKAALLFIALHLSLPAMAQTVSAQLDTKPGWMQYKNPYIGEQNDLANPHRSAEEILSWADQRATDFLSFGEGEMTAKLETMKKDFIQQGWLSYASYLRSSQLFDMVYNQGYSVTTIINGRSNIIGKGTASGAYHWLISAPLMITFMKKDTQGQLQPVGSGRYLLTLQVGRVKKGGDDNSIAIESWELKSDPSAQ